MRKALAAVAAFVLFSLAMRVVWGSWTIAWFFTAFIGAIAIIAHFIPVYRKLFVGILIGSVIVSLILPRVVLHLDARFPETRTALDRRTLALDDRMSKLIDPPMTYSKLALSAFVKSLDEITYKQIEVKLNDLLKKKTDGLFDVTDAVDLENIVYQIQVCEQMYKVIYEAKDKGTILSNLKMVDVKIKPEGCPLYDAVTGLRKPEIKGASIQQVGVDGKKIRGGAVVLVLAPELVVQNKTGGTIIDPDKRYVPLSLREIFPPATLFAYVILNDGDNMPTKAESRNGWIPFYGIEKVLNPHSEKKAISDVDSKWPDRLALLGKANLSQLARLAMVVLVLVIVIGVLGRSKKSSKTTKIVRWACIIILVACLFAGLKWLSGLAEAFDFQEETDKPKVVTSEGIVSMSYALASYYGDGEALNEETASRELFDPTRLTAAHRTLPFDTFVRVTNTDDRSSYKDSSVVVRVNDRGPADWPEPYRDIDLTLYAFEAIAEKDLGLIQVKMEALSQVPAGAMVRRAGRHSTTSQASVSKPDRWQVVDRISATSLKLAEGVALPDGDALTLRWPRWGFLRFRVVGSNNSWAQYLPWGDNYYVGFKNNREMVLHGGMKRYFENNGLPGYAVCLAQGDDLIQSWPLTLNQLPENNATGIDPDVIDLPVFQIPAGTNRILRVNKPLDIKAGIEWDDNFIIILEVLEYQTSYGAFINERPLFCSLLDPEISSG